MNTFWQDIRYAMRGLGRNPGFTLVTVVTLAFGIGANSAIFSVVNTVLLKPLPYRDPAGLVKVWTRFTGIGLPNDQNWFSAPEFRDLSEQNRSFSAISVLRSEEHTSELQSRGHLVCRLLLEKKKKLKLLT